MRKFGRWYTVVYPTSETKYRNATAQEPYDYPLALVDEGEGPTELEFAPKIKEPWSQNITFNLNDLRWKQFVEPGISIATTSSDYSLFGGSVLIVEVMLILNHVENLISQS